MSLNQMPSYCWYWLAAASTIDAEVTEPSPYLDARSSASSTRVHLWFRLFVIASAGSSTGGNAPPAVRGPFDAENSVATTDPERGVPGFQRRITPAVSAMAVSVVAYSRGARDPPAIDRNPAPPYTWHDWVSQVLAYE